MSTINIALTVNSQQDDGVTAARNAYNATFPDVILETNQEYLQWVMERAIASYVRMYITG